MGSVDIFAGGLKADECLSKYEVISEPLLSGVCFSIFIGVLLIYEVFVLLFLFYQSLFILCRDLIFKNNNIFSVKNDSSLKALVYLV
jgi:hypothetical protein